jgi:hypothetical protein
MPHLNSVEAHGSSSSSSSSGSSKDARRSMSRQSHPQRGVCLAWRKAGPQCMTGDCTPFFEKGVPSAQPPPASGKHRQPQSPETYLRAQRRQQQRLRPRRSVP